MSTGALQARPTPALAVHYRPLSRGQWVGRTLGIALGFGTAVATVMMIPTIGLWTGIAGYAVLVGWALRRRGRLHRLLRQNDEAVALLAAGELAAAARALDELCVRTRSAPGVHSIVVANRGVVHLRAGQYEAARSLLQAVMRAGWLSGRRSTLALVFPMVAGGLATVEALVGDLDAAENWRVAAHERVSDVRRGTLLLVDAVVGARREQWREVIERVSAGWPRAENLLGASQMRATRLIEGLARERAASGQYRGDAADSEVRDALDAARPHRPGEFDYLARPWPQFAEFLGRHGFIEAAAPPTKT